jgi:hypothetical protein
LAAQKVQPSGIVAVAPWVPFALVAKPMLHLHPDEVWSVLLYVLLYHGQLTQSSPDM